MHAVHMETEAARLRSRSRRFDRRYRCGAAPGEVCWLSGRPVEPRCVDAATTERLRHSVLSGVTGSTRSYAKFCRAASSII
jgi:hypothetical protein